MKSERAFETVWLCGGQEIERRTIRADDMDAAMVAAWMSLLTVSRQDRKPCDTMRITDTANGQCLTEDVPPFTLPSRRIGKAVLIFLTGCVALWVGIWMARHGWARAGGVQGKWLIYTLMAFPMGWIIAIVVIATSQQSRQDAIAQWKKDFGDLRPATAPLHPRMARIVLARLSPWRMLPRLAMLLGIIGALLWFPITSRLSSGHWELWDPVLLALSAVLIVSILPMMHQMLFDGSAALWIQGGELVQYQSTSLCVPIWSIVSVTVGEFKPPKGFAYTAILLINNDGTVLPIRAVGFREGCEEIAARLDALLRLSPPRDVRAGQTGQVVRPTAYCGS